LVPENNAKLADCSVSSFAVIILERFQSIHLPVPVVQNSLVWLKILLDVHCAAVGRLSGAFFLPQAFLETNIYLLVLTFVISIVHSVFEFLAFKNDIQFWNNRLRPKFILCKKNSQLYLTRCTNLKFL
jgi:hypothetical protein